MYRTICYECGIPCPRAGKKLTNNSRICNGWKDPKFVGCCALEDPEEAMKRMEAERRLPPRPKHKTAMQFALEKAGVM